VRDIFVAGCSSVKNAELSCSIYVFTFVTDRLVLQLQLQFCAFSIALRLEKRPLGQRLLAHQLDS